MALQSGFLWGQGGEKLTASDVAKNRQLADALLAKNSEVASNPWEGLAQLTGAFSGTMLNNEASAAEAEQRGALAELLSSGDYQGVIGNEFASPQQSALAQALWQQQMREQEIADQRAYDAPMRELETRAKEVGLEQALLDLETARNPPPPDPMVINDQLVNPIDASVLGDYRDAPEPPTRPLTMEEKATYGIPPEMPAQIGPDGKVSMIGGSGVTVNNNMGDSLTPGQKKIDEQFADTYLTWTGGGFADAGKQLSQLNESLAILETEEGVTGAVGVLPDVVQPFINERGTIARENVEEVVQRTLRETLGAQFTEREGERLIARAFNPKLPPQENAKRVRRLIDKVRESAEAKQEMVEYFETNGTLQGYKGRRPNPTELTKLADEFEREDGGEEVGGQQQSPANPSVFNGPQPGPDGTVDFSDYFK